MRLYLVRHGQTDWNLHHRFQGQTDIPLNQTGEEQADRIARRLSRTKIDIIYSSDLRRTLQTAECIASYHHIQFITDPRWRELSFGLWEGLTYAEIRAREPQLLEKWQEDPENAAAPEGETLRQLAMRVASALEDLRSDHADHTVLLTVHGGTIQCLFCLALGIELNHYWQFAVSSASLSEMEFFSEGVIINLFNDTSHIAKA